MYRFKINNIETNDGTIINAEHINIIVGPNSSGKSRFLKDIKDMLGDGYNNISSGVVIKKMDYDLPYDKNDFIESYDLRNRVRTNGNGNYTFNNYSGVHNSLNMNASFDSILSNNNGSFSSYWESELDSMIHDCHNMFFNISIPDGANNVEVTSDGYLSYEINGEQHVEVLGSGGTILDEGRNMEFIKRYGCLFYQYLGTEEKLLACKRQKNFGFDSSEINLLSEVKNRLEDMKKLSQYTKRIFGKYVYLDRISYGDSIAIRVSDDFDFYNQINFDNSNSERKLLDYPLLDDEGDGIKNFVSTFLSIKGQNKDIILIDEPESFLHPPLARTFGELIAKEVKDNQQLFIVTHSEDIINGIFLNCPTTKINVIRIERNNDKNIVSVMPSNFRLRIRRSPIFMMSNILKGLFSEKIYVTESFSDSAFYHSLMNKYNGFGNYYFVNTEGKDKIGSILELYDSVNIDSVGIYDFDYFRSQEIVTKSLYKKLGSCPEYDFINNVLKRARKYLDDKATDAAKSLFVDVDKDLLKKEKSKILDDYYHKDGINSIDDDNLKDELNIALEKMKQYGIYVIKCGSLESTLVNVGCDYSNNKSNWIDDALDFVQKCSDSDIEKLDIFDLISGL